MDRSLAPSNYGTIECKSLHICYQCEILSLYPTNLKQTKSELKKKLYRK